jgi:hypothetical protein
MSRAIQDILGWVALTRAIQKVKDGVPNPFPNWLFTVKGEDKVLGNSVKYHRLYGTKKAARVVKYGAAPRHRPLQDEELVEPKFMHFSEERIFEPLMLTMLRDYESYDNGMKAKRLVANNVQTMATLFQNARIVAVATTLARGNVYVDSDGNLLPTSSGASETYSHQISSTNNIGSILDGASAGIFGATGGGSWANNSTNIPLQLRRLQEHAAQQHGYIPRVALYGKNVVEYLSQNDYVLDYMARTPGLQSVGLKDNTIPSGLFGFDWQPTWMASYDKDDGTKTALWPSDGVTFMPGPEDQGAFWSMFEGSYEVPTSLNLMTDATSALNSLKTVYGMGGYGQVTIKPVMVSTVLFDTFWPAVKLPEALYIADVVA